jgi:hypothetical protein
VAEAFVLETLRTARTKASPRCGFAGVSPVGLELVAAVSGAAELGVAVLVERVAS